MANDQPAAPEENIIISVLKKQRARYEKLIVEAEALGSDVAPVVELIRKDIARTDAAIAEANSLDRLREEDAELRNERDEARQGWAERNHQIMNMARALNCTVDVVSEKVALLTAERDTAQARALMLQDERQAPIDALLFCPQCNTQHVDEAKPGVCEKCGHSKEEHHEEERCTEIPGYHCMGNDVECDCAWFQAWLNPPHKSHRCVACNHVWRPADVPTNGVAELKTKGERDGDPKPRSVESEIHSLQSSLAAAEARATALQSILELAATSLKPDVYSTQESWMRAKLADIEHLARKAMNDEENTVA